MFGTCPACGERMEFTLDAGELATQLEPVARAEPAEWTEDGRRYRLRPVTTEDLLATLAAPDPDAAQALLLDRCVEQIQDHDLERLVVPAARSGYPRGAVDRFGELHADAELRCAIECPACSTRHVHDFDIARFLWREVPAAARRLLAEMHALAAAYGWSQQDILRLSPLRRAAYLQLAGT